MKPTIHRPIAPEDIGHKTSSAPRAPLLPHERDEFVGSVDPVPDARMVQAKKDLDAGLVDTDMRATPGLDAARRDAMVPGAGGQPPRVNKPG